VFLGYFFAPAKKSLARLRAKALALKDKSQS
jgi:hypothetical protein